jgi:hypothetical protein
MGRFHKGFTEEAVRIVVRDSYSWSTAILRCGSTICAVSKFSDPNKEGGRYGSLHSSKNSWLCRLPLGIQHLRRTSDRVCAEWLMESYSLALGSFHYARVAALMAAELGIAAHPMQKALETHVRAHLAELAEVAPDLR